MSPSRAEEVKEAFAWDTDYDIVLALKHLTFKKYEGAEPDVNILTEGEKVVLFTTLFDNEVNNGGFHQFFTNPSGNYTLEILRILESIGAVNSIRIFNKALSIFPNDKSVKDQDARICQVLNAGKDGIEFLSSLDEEYFTKEERIYTLMVEFLKGRESDFL